LLRFCKKLVRVSKLRMAIDLSVCMGIVLSGWLATTLPVLASELNQSPATTHSETPPCHGEAIPQKKDTCVDEAEICVLCPACILHERIQSQFSLTSKLVYFTFHGPLESISFRPELHPPINHQLS